MCLLRLQYRPKEVFYKRGKNKMNGIKEAIELINQGKVRKFDGYWKVNEYTIMENKKAGRTLLLCDCQNATMYADATICKHKKAVIIMEYLNDRIKNKK